MSEPLKTRREKEKQARYDTILDAAELVFSEKGYERTSMDDIARTAALSRALLYVYFKDKAAIQRGIMLRAGHSLFRRFEEASQTADNRAGPDIRAMGVAYYRFYREEPDYFSALTKASTAMADADDEPGRGDVVLQIRNLMELMVGAIQLGLEDGTMNRERIHNPVQTALYLRGALHGVIMLCQSEMGEGNPEFPAEQLIRHTMDMLTSSIAA